MILELMPNSSEKSKITTLSWRSLTRPDSHAVVNVGGGRTSVASHRGIRRLAASRRGTLRA